MDRIREVNNHEPSRFRPFHVAGVVAGCMTPDFADALRAWEDVFQVGEHGVRLAASLEADSISVEQRGRAVDTVLVELRDLGTIDGWRDEIHKVARHWTEPPLLLVERAAIPYLGSGGFAVHMNAFVRKSGWLYLWVARRSADKLLAPGKLDHLVAGGQPAHLSLKRNLVKECAEEAGIPPSLAEAAKPTGYVSYAYDSPRGHRPDVVYTFDLELPAGFEPVNSDGEVAEFHLWPVEEVARIVSQVREFKYNCALVVIDFLIRYGVIGADHADFADIVAGLRCRRA